MGGLIDWGDWLIVPGMNASTPNQLISQKAAKKYHYQVRLAHIHTPVNHRAEAVQAEIISTLQFISHRGIT